MTPLLLLLSYLRHLCLEDWYATRSDLNTYVFPLSNMGRSSDLDSGIVFTLQLRIVFNHLARPPVEILPSG